MIILLTVLMIMMTMKVKNKVNFNKKEGYI